jgi:hypothetical protein
VTAVYQGKMAGQNVTVGPFVIFRAGQYLVGKDIVAGRVYSDPASGCYWERLRDFTGSLGAIVANDFVSSAGSQLVTIQASDVGFSTDGECGTWTPVQGLLPSESAPERRQSTADIERNWLVRRQASGAPTDRIPR